MHSSGSFLKTVLERVRGLLDEPSSKYTDSYIVNHMIMPEMANVLSRVELMSASIILQRFDLDVVINQEYYQLPPNVGEIHQIVQYDDHVRVIKDFSPREERNRGGPGWRIEGNTLAIRPIPQRATTWSLVYKAEGDFMPHFATDGELVEVNNRVTRLYLTSNPELGQVDRRPNAYASAVLRILPDSPGVVEERIVSVHAPEASSPYVDVRVPFDHARTVLGSTGSAWEGSSSSNETQVNVAYEIAPVGSQSLYQAIAVSTAIQLGVMKNISQKQMQFLHIEYRKALKTAGDRLSSMNMRKPKHYEKGTHDNREGNLWFLS